MSLLRDIRSLVVAGQDEVCFTQLIMKRIRVALVNSFRDDQETEFLLANFSSRTEPAVVKMEFVKHLIDFLRGEPE
jgi:hypothetical protein